MPSSGSGRRGNKRNSLSEGTEWYIEQLGDIDTHEDMRCDPCREEKIAVVARTRFGGRRGAIEVLVATWDSGVSL